MLNENRAMSQRQRKYSTAKELRVFLVHLLCILTLVQGPPLEAAEQQVRERTLWVGEAESAEAGESLPDKAAGPVGQVSATIDALNPRTTFTYDDLGGQNYGRHTISG